MESFHDQNPLKREATGQLQEPNIVKKLKSQQSSSSSSSSNLADFESESDEEVVENDELLIKNKRLQRKNKFDRNRKIFIRPKELEDQDVQGWYLTKKLVGIFAYWDGRDLYSCSGRKYKPPHSFIKDFPENYPLLGVLNKPGADLQEHRNIVNQKGEEADDWLSLKFSVYDTSEGDGKFKNRIEEIKSSLIDNSSYVELSNYKKINSEIDILNEIRELEEKEAIYFKHPEKPYLSGIRGGFLQLFPQNSFGKAAIKRFCQVYLAKGLNIKDLLF